MATPTARNLRAQLEAQQRKEAVATVSVAWRQIQERHDDTTGELTEDVRLDAWILAALSDLADVQQVAKEAIQRLSTFALNEMNMSALSLGTAAGVAHHTIRRWAATDDESNL